jgi:YtkA-like
MHKIVRILAISAAIVIYGCKSDPVSIEEGSSPEGYVKIHTAAQNGATFEVWSATSANSFIYGYNDIGFKVLIDNVEQTTGFVKFIPTMYHGLGGPRHTTPTDDIFNYNTDKSLFTGYVVFMMYDTAAFWAGRFNYNNTSAVDSFPFQIQYSSLSQVLGWDNVNTQRTYLLTLISPRSPRLGLNAIDVLLHESADLQSFTEVESAEMFIRPWMESMGHGSGNNTNPVSLGGGKYRGEANFTMAGEWFLYDSIKVNNQFITRTPPPKFIFDVY